jgi:hypothetical protein
VTGVEKREMEIPMGIQKHEVDLDEEVLGVAAPARWGRGSGSSTTWAG